MRSIPRRKPLDKPGPCVQLTPLQAKSDLSQGVRRGETRTRREAHLPHDRQEVLRPEPRSDRLALHGRGAPARHVRARPPRLGAAKAAPQPDEDEAELEVADAELVSLEEADGEEASPAKAAVIDDDVDVDVEDTGDDDDTFLEEDEDEDDGDVSDLIGDAGDDDEDQ